MSKEATEPRSGIKTALVFIMLFAVLGAVIVFGYYSTFNRPLTTIIFIRHAEKNIEPNNPDPDLSPAGHARAQEIVRMFGNADIGAIYATQYRRTQQTVKPLADRLGIPVTQVNTGNSAEVLSQIRSQHSGKVILVAGHNNTVPQMITALGGPQLPIIPEADYDDLYIVTIYRVGKPKLMKLKYGNQTEAGR